MSRLPEASPQQGRVKKQSSSRTTVTRRLALSWTRWRQSRREKRLARQRAKMERLLRPLLLEALTPVAQAMSRLEQRQQEALTPVLRLEQQHQAKVRLEQAQLAETRELLVEILQSLQPPAEQVIAQQVGLSAPPTWGPSSES